MLFEFFLKNGLFFSLFATMLAFWIENISTIELSNRPRSWVDQRPFDTSYPRSYASWLSPVSWRIWLHQVWAGSESAGGEWPEANPARGTSLERPPADFDQGSEPMSISSEKKFSFFSLCICFIFLTCLLLFRWISSGYPPLSSLYESLLFLSWGFISLYFLFIIDGRVGFSGLRPSSFAPLVAFGSESPLADPELNGLKTASYSSAEVTESTPIAFSDEWPEACGAPSPKADTYEVSGQSESYRTQRAPRAMPSKLGEAQKVHPPSSAGYAEPALMGKALFGGQKALVGDVAVSQVTGNRYRDNYLAAPLGFVITASVLFIDTFAEWQLPESMRQIKPLIPALQSNWLLMHVSIMILSYASLILGSIFSITYLILDTIDTWRNKKLLESSLLTSTTVYCPPKYDTTIPPAEPRTNGFAQEYSSTLENVGNSLDVLSYKLLSFGFPLLTLGILSGSIWANEAWGSYWSWDPKETWAFITWLVFAFYLHTRINYSWSGRSSAYVATFGFFIVWICYLGVNILGKGLHSYGWISS